MSNGDQAEEARGLCDPNAQRAAVPRSIAYAQLDNERCRLHYITEVERGRLSSALAFSTSSWLPRGCTRTVKLRAPLFDHVPQDHARPKARPSRTLV